MTARCWGFHSSTIPVDSMDQVVDAAGRLWARTAPRIWEHDGARKHEGWLLREHGPVRCPVELTAGLPLTEDFHPPVDVRSKCAPRT